MLDEGPLPLGVLSDVLLDKERRIVGITLLVWKLEDCRRAKEFAGRCDPRCAHFFSRDSLPVRYLDSQMVPSCVLEFWFGDIEPSHVMAMQLIDDWLYVRSSTDHQDAFPVAWRYTDVDEETLQILGSMLQS